MTANAAGPEIIKVVIEGNQKIEAAAIYSKIKSVPKSALNPELIREDIRSIFALGFFDDISVTEDKVAGGVSLIFSVKEKPILAKLEFEGVEEIDEDERKDLVVAKQYEVLDIHKLNQSVEKMTAKYEEKGFYLADVRYDVALDEKKNEANVKFTVHENDKIRVKSINIIGNKVVLTDDLFKVMQTQEGGPFSWMTGSGAFREAVFERDIAALSMYYGTLGYIRARFGKPEVTVSPDKRWVNITFYVEEGDEYFVGDIDFSGELLYKREELQSDLLMKNGDVFNTEILRRQTLFFTDKYGDLGYAFANIVPQPNIHDDTKKVDITYDVDLGDRVYLGKITITGNTRTKDKVIRRELRMVEGELFNNSKKRESRDAIQRLGFFDDVQFHQNASKSNPNLVDVEIQVKERSTGQLVIGAGYASGQAGFIFQAQLSQNNFLGNGQMASLSAQIMTGQQFYEFSLGLHEPYLGYSNWSLGGDLYQLRRQVFSLSSVKTFDETKTGFDIKLGHPVLEFTNLFLTYKLENSSVPENTIIDRTLIPLHSVNGVTSSVTASVVFDKRDDRLDPRNGWYWNVAGEFAGLGSQRKFFKSTAGIKFFHPIISDIIFRTNVTAGNISAVGDAEIPINELFIQGGLYSLRGYDFLSIGPKARLSSDPANLSADAIAKGVQGQQIVIGGRNQVLFNSEIEFPILREAKLRGVFFFDAGNAFNGSMSTLSPTLYANVGWGVRWFTPIGPLRFEFGYPIVNPGPAKFYFTIGPPF